jgi:hypothetical protein
VPCVLWQQFGAFIVEVDWKHYRFLEKMSSIDQCVGIDFLEVSDLVQSILLQSNVGQSFKVWVTITLLNRMTNFFTA